MFGDVRVRSSEGPDNDFRRPNSGRLLQTLFVLVVVSWATVYGSSLEETNVSGTSQECMKLFG